MTCILGHVESARASTDPLITLFQSLQPYPIEGCTVVFYANGPTLSHCSTSCINTMHSLPFFLLLSACANLFKNQCWTYAGVHGRCWTLGMLSCTSSLQISENITTWKASMVQLRRFHCCSSQRSASSLTGQINCAEFIMTLLFLTGRPTEELLCDSGNIVENNA